MKYAVLVRTFDILHHMVGSCRYATQTYVFPSELKNDVVPIECISLDGLPFSSIELR